MLALTRPALKDAAQRWLEERQAEVDAMQAPDTTAIWKQSRPELNDNGVCRALRSMVGVRERCVYCGDSVATDVEHYQPKRRYPSTMFVWSNLLWACGPCNRKKGQQFPRAADGSPLLIDPTVIDPWDHLFFVRETGELTPRFDPTTGTPDALGEATLSPKLLRINVESVTTARVRAWRALRREVRHFLDAGATEGARLLLVEAFTDTERPDVAVWVLEREGANVEPFSTLLGRHPEIGRMLLATMGQKRSPA